MASWDDYPELMNSQQCSECVGYCRQTWRTKRLNGELPRALTEGRPGRRLLWKKTDLILWLKWDCPSQEVFERRKKLSA